MVAAARTEASAARDFTVKVDAGGLRPGRTYYYAFDAGGDHSPVGRTQDAAAQASWRACGSRRCPARTTPPATSTSIAASPIATDLDAVLHLGDYIYEFANGIYGDGSAIGPGAAAGRRSRDARPTTGTRYATYRSDPDLQAAHARHPFIAVWDDHEIVNDCVARRRAERTPRRRRRGRRGWPAPIRRIWSGCPCARSRTAGIHLYRGFRFGRLADLLMLDTRGLRDRQAHARDAATLADPARTLLGADAGVLALRSACAVAARRHDLAPARTADRCSRR